MDNNHKLAAEEPERTLICRGNYDDQEYLTLFNAIISDKSELTHRELLGKFSDKVLLQCGRKSLDQIGLIFVDFEQGLGVAVEIELNSRKSHGKIKRASVGYCSSHFSGNHHKYVVGSDTVGGKIDYRDNEDFRKLCQRSRAIRKHI